MMIILLVLVFTAIVLSVFLFVVVVAGIHSEPHYGMTSRAQRPLAAMVRRLLGVYVTKPADTDTHDREECFTGQPTDWWNKGGGDR